jgi:hypothetical protein
MVTQFSEPSGVFQQELMSNEDSQQFVIPELKEKAARSGVYIGVGPEQNFTYAAAIEPRLAFVVDIRRDNMLQQLMYKALFELSSDRADFVSRLFARKRPAGMNAASTVKELFDSYQSVESDPDLYENTLRLVLDRLVNVRKFQLSDADKASISRMMNSFRTAGPFGLKGSGDKNMTYAQSMTGTDRTGRNQSFLASEQNFRVVQKLEMQNLIVPLVGDFAGDKALASIGRYLSEHNAKANVFYVSNVERYLFDQGEHGRKFYANVAALPLDSSSLFIRSVTVDISRRLGIPIPDGPENWRSFLFPINDCLKASADGRLKTYRDLFVP